MKLTQAMAPGSGARTAPEPAASPPLAYATWQDMVFGQSHHPVRCGFGVEIGAGQVHPEIKYHPRPGTEQALATLSAEYDRIISAQTVEWEGKETTLTQLRPVYLDANRNATQDRRSARMLTPTSTRVVGM